MSSIVTSVIITPMNTGSTSDTTPTRGERRRAQTRARLLEAARTLFARQGVEATAIAEITEVADVGFGSFYNHFTSKEELVDTVLAEALEAQARLVDGLTTNLDDPAEVVAVAHRHFIAQTQTNPEIGWLLVRLDASHRILTDALGQRARRDIRNGIKTGRFDVPDLEAAFYDTGGALLLTLRAILDGDLPPTAEIHHTQAVLRILGLPPKEAATIARRPMPTPQKPG
jgi:AcrR family transcriptional regulator